MTQGEILPTHYIRVSNNEGTAIFDQFSGCSYAVKKNGIGHIQFNVNADDERVRFFTLDAQIELFRAIPGVGLDYYREFVGLHQSSLKKTHQDGRKVLTSIAVHTNDLLARRVVAWQKGRPQSAKSNFASVALKEYVLENCGPGARAANGRVRDGTMYNFFVEDSGSIQGPVWTGDRSLETVFDVAREIAAYGGFSFEVVAEGKGLDRTFLFRTASSFGEDHSAAQINPNTGKNMAGYTPVIFSTDRGTVQEIELEEDRAGEKNAVFATGEIGGVAQTVFMESIHALDSPYNDREAVTTGGGRSDTTIQELLNQAAETLNLNQVRRIIRFTPRQTVSALYGRDYKTGYQVTSRYDDVTDHPTVWETNVTINDDGSEKIEMELY